mgnify:CR=1 FL=1
MLNRNFQITKDRLPIYTLRKVLQTGPEKLVQCRERPRRVQVVAKAALEEPAQPPWSLFRFIGMFEKYRIGTIPTIEPSLGLSN